MAPSELDEFLSRAVDRQIAEQRALREALNDLRAAVESLGSRPVEASFDSEAFDQRIVHVANEVRSATHDEMLAVRRELAEMRGLLGTQTPPEAPELDIGPLRDELASVNANIDGIAQALIDLNAGLRDWAAGVDEGITSLVRALNIVRGIADEGRKAAIAANDSLALEVADKTDDTDDYADERMEEVEARIEESGQLAMNIRDRLDEFERLATEIRDIPKSIEGTVTQVVRRAMAARAKLDKDAETAMDETLAAVDEQIDALNDTIANIGSSDDQIRKVALGQVELSSRIESLQDAFLARLEAIEADNRDAQEALARAIDRSAAGRDPRAAESVRKPARKPSKPKPAPRKPPPRTRRRAKPPEVGER